MCFVLCFAVPTCSGDGALVKPRSERLAEISSVKVRFVDGRGLGQTGVVQLASGGRTTCARLQDGDVGCWGGLFGDVPGRLAGIHDIASIAIGEKHVCVLSRAGEVACGGSNEYGQAGHPERVLVHPFVQVDGVDGATAIFAGGDDTCVRGRGPGLTCWGRSFARPEEPMRRVVVLDKHDIVRAGLSRYDNVALTASGRILWWGRPEYFESHNGRYFATYADPADVELDGRAVDACAARYHSCALAASGVIHCWGLRGAATWRLGFQWKYEYWPYQGDRISSIPKSPTVVGITDAVELACGDDHSCARLGSGEVRCWGAETLLGADVTADEARLFGAHAVDSVADAIHIAVGDRRACAALRSGSLVCWGDDGLGASGVNGSIVPVLVDRED